MSIKVKKRKGENFISLLYRFNRKIKRSGVLREAKKRMFYQKELSKNQQRKSALYRDKKRKEIEELTKYGHGPFSGRRK
jgi:ribosomal protein S21